MVVKKAFGLMKRRAHLILGRVIQRQCTADNGWIASPQSLRRGALDGELQLGEPLEWDRGGWRRGDRRAERNWTGWMDPSMIVLFFFPRYRHRLISLFVFSGQFEILYRFFFLSVISILRVRVSAIDGCHAGGRPALRWRRYY